MDMIDLYKSFQSWGIRWNGYRSERINIDLPSGKKCRVAYTAHVNPKVENFTLLLHGLGDSRYSWWKWIVRYEDHPLFSSFIAVDWPQHGDTKCESALEMDDITEVLDRTIKKIGRPISRIIGNSLGVLPAAYLAKRYPQAQQIWMTPPLLNEKALKEVRADVLGIDSNAEVQVFMNRVLTEDRDIPNFLRSEFLERIQNSQRVLRKLSIKKVQKDLFARKYHKLLVIAASKDELVPPQELDSRVAPLAAYPIKYVPCGHDILRHCGEDVKILVEQTRYDLQKAKY